MTYTVRRKAGGPDRLVIDKRYELGRGATAVVYRVQLDGRRLAAKVYHPGRPFNGEKIRAMLDSPPDSCEVVHNGQEYPQLAWPIAIIEDSQGREAGFLLPLVDTEESFTLDHYYDLGLFNKLQSRDEGALSYKLEIARNLCRIVADLHRHEHYFIDCKPQNIRVFRRNHVVTLIDCDGFSIKGKAGRYPGELLSTDYIAPEVQRRQASPTELGEPQDRYALAVLLFQLLNRGTHPFQGIITDAGIFCSTNDEKAAARLYPHGLVSNGQIRPRPQSIHHLWDHQTRSLFDQAFTSHSPSARPSAQEWADHFGGLLESRSLVRCDRIPHDLEHIRFRGMDCPACYLQGLSSSTPQKSPPSSSRPRESQPQAAQPAPTATAASPSSSGRSNLGWWILAVIGVIFLILILNSGSQQQASRPQVASPQPPPAPPVPASYEPAAAVKGRFISLYASESRAVGYSIGNSTSVAADGNARVQCEVTRSGPTDRCSKVIEGEGGCISISRASNGALGAAIADSRAVAQVSAKTACTRNGGEDCPHPSEETFCVK